MDKSWVFGRKGIEVEAGCSVVDRRTIGHQDIRATGEDSQGVASLLGIQIKDQAFLIAVKRLESGTLSICRPWFDEAKPIPLWRFKFENARAEFGQ